MSRRYTNSDVDEYLKANNRLIIRQESYKNSRHPILWQCKICQHNWTATYSNIKLGKGCPRCARVLRITNEEIDEYLKSNHPTIARVSDYKNAKNKVLWKCYTCNNSWTNTYETLRKSKGCPICLRSTKYTDESIDNYLKIEGLMIKRKGTYTNNKDNTMLWECLKCNSDWQTSFSSIRNQKSGCPKCKASSRGENRVRKVLETLEVNYEEEYTFEDCLNTNLLRYDFAVVNKQANKVLLLIEYDGIQHYEPREYFGGLKSYLKVVENDTIKNNYCDANNLPLLRIPYTEYDNIEKIVSEAIDALNEKEQE